MPLPNDNWLNVQIRSEPLSVEAATVFVTSPEVGAIDLFLGTTRAETHPTFGQLLHLDYEAHTPLAIAEIIRITNETKDRWPVHRAWVHHRIGVVPVGDASVIIAISCPHRAEAFDATQHIIDELKLRVPIWKKEVYAAHSNWQKDAEV